MKRKILYINTGELIGKIMVNVRQITGVAKSVSAWVKASGKSSVLQTKPQSISNPKGFKYKPVNKEFQNGLFDNELFSFAKQHKFLTSDGKISEDGLALVRLDDDIPKNGILRTVRDKIKGPEGSKGSRNSLHFAINHPVQAVACENSQRYSWANKKHAYILPFNEVKNIVGGNPVDIYTKGSVKLPKGTVIIRQNRSIPEGKYKVIDAEKIKKFKNLHGVKVIETAQTPHEATPYILEKLGYEVKPCGNCSWADTIDKNFLDFMKSKNLFVSMHSYTPNARIEFMIEAIADRAYFNMGWQLKSTTGETLYNYRDAFAKCIDSIENMAKKYNYPLDFDTKKLKKIIEKAKTPQQAMAKIQKELKLTSMYDNSHNLFLDETQFLNKVGFRVGSSHPINEEYQKRCVDFIQGKREKTWNEFESDLTKWFQSLVPANT